MYYSLHVVEAKIMHLPVPPQLFGQTKLANKID